MRSFRAISSPPPDLARARVGTLLPQRQHIPEPIAVVVLTPPPGAVNVGSTLALTAQAQDAKGKVLDRRAFVFASSDTNRPRCPRPVS